MYNTNIYIVFKVFGCIKAYKNGLILKTVMANILYRIYVKKGSGAINTPIWIPEYKNSDLSRELAGVAMSDLGLEQFFGDVWWGSSRVVNVFLADISGVQDKKLVRKLEEILGKRRDKRVKFGVPSKEILKKRKPRKGNYIYCIPGIVPDWVDAEYMPSHRLEK
jgi:hypothetical protein